MQFVQGSSDVVRSDGRGGQARWVLAGGATYTVPAGKYPITVKWRYASGATRSRIATFDSNPGIEGQPTELRGEGTLALFLGSGGEWRLQWVHGDSHLTKSDFKKMAEEG